MRLYSLFCSQKWITQRSNGFAQVDLMLLELTQLLLQKGQEPCRKNLTCNFTGSKKFSAEINIFFYITEDAVYALQAMTLSKAKPSLTSRKSNI